MTAALLALLLAQTTWKEQGILISDESVKQGYAKSVNCTGTGVTCSSTGYVWTINVTSGGGGAPTTATYVTQTPDAGLSAEQALSTLGTGLVQNTTGTGVLSIYGGATCTAPNFVQTLSASGVPGCAQPTNVTGNAGTATALAADPTDCTSGQYATAIAANGNLTCATPAGGAPGGSDTYVQFNDATAFGGDAGMVYNKTTDTLTIGTNARVPTLSITQPSLGGADVLILDRNGTGAIIDVPLGNLQITATGGGTITMNGQAATATAFAADPADCTAGQYATGISASGALTCSAPTAVPPSVEVDVDFGATESDDVASTVVTGQTWVTATSKIVCSPTMLATTSRAEGAEDAVIEGLTAAAHSRVVGTGFTVTVAAPVGLGTTGVYKIHCTGG